MNIGSQKRCADTNGNTGTLDFVGELLSHAEGSKFPPAKLKPNFMVRALGTDQFVCYYLMTFAFKEGKNWVRPAVLVTESALGQGLPANTGRRPEGQDRYRVMSPSWNTCPALSLTLASQGQNHRAKIWQTPPRIVLYSQKTPRVRH